MSHKENLYKYISIKNLKRFLEIIRDQQLYAPTIDELNDAKEGAFRYPTGCSSSDKSAFFKMLKDTHTCSLSKLKNNGHMFAIYGDSHKGCCIELVVTATSWKKVDVEYSDSIPQISSTSKDSLSEVLSVKSSQWGDEEEIRYFKYYDKSQKSKQFLKVKIHQIMFGVKVSQKDFELYKRIINGINSDIDVVLLKEKDIDFGFA